MSSLLDSVSSSGTGVTASVDSFVDVRNSLVPETVQVVIQPGASIVTEDGTSLLTTAGNNVGGGEPPAKRQRVDDVDTDQSQSIKTILFNINKAICLRLDAIENKMETVSLRTKYLEEKLEQVVSQMRMNGAQAAGGIAGQPQQPLVVVSQPNTPNKQSPGVGSRRSSAVVVGLPQEKMTNSTSSGSPASTGSGDQAVHSLGPNVTLITLNSEEDFPNGVWLGDENNPEMRVRAPITPSDLLHIHSNCRTPEKMALSLLDYLFDRDTQATSNLSGMGKHGKKQLDPLMIYGIRCHLIHRFTCTEQDWHRIKQNIDSKCRTAFRRRMRGLPLTVKAFRGKAPPTYVHVMNSQGGLLSPSDLQEIQDTEDALSQDNSELQIHEEVDIGHHGAGIMQPTVASAADLIQNAGGQIQVLHATPEQVAQLQQTHQIQILHGDQVMQLQSSAEGPDGIHVAVSLPNQADDHSGVHVITADGTETVHIKRDPGAGLPSPPTDGAEDEELQLSVQEGSVDEDDD